MTPTTPRSIPVLIICGFLGSGKTTLLLRLLAQHTRISVIMNEIGSLDIDREILANASHKPHHVHSLLTGCLCCDHIDKLYTTLTNASSTDPDAIVIELSGIAHPSEVACVIADHPHTHVHNIATVIDTPLLTDYMSWLNPDRSIRQTIEEHLRCADVLIMNKIDRASRKELEKAKKIIQNHPAKTIWTSHTRIDTTVLWTPTTQHHTPIARHNPRIHTKKLLTRRAFPSRAALMRTVRSWNIYRAKGTLTIAHTPHLFHYAHKQTTVTPHPHDDTGIVLIGMPEHIAHAVDVWENRPRA
ncbi:MAG: GTP-binding protein [Paenibacillaceae bacterium]|nr:GTP-binding protein [Paenibacillaceae bacterium]